VQSHDNEYFVGHVACTGEMRNSYKILVGKPEGKSTQKTEILLGAQYKNESGMEGVDWT
jgi:hypothetical protein